MSVRTHVHVARERVRNELERVTEKRSAIEQFRRDVESVSPATPIHAGEATRAGPATPVTPQVQLAQQRNHHSTKPCERIREAFAETIRPHSVSDLEEPEPLSMTILAELGDEIATVLAPNVDVPVTPPVKRAICSTIDDRLAETDAMEKVLETEADSLVSAETELDAITEWLVAANETELSALGFEELRERHETLAQHRRSCDRLLRDRQAVLHGATTGRPTAGTDHRRFLEYLYRPLPVAYPVLVTTLRLESVLADCQRIVRDHLIRRV
ncbi:DUF7260 family protein [Natronorubrum sp. FCH18a]|uniref:DUF7260 family protein n=1 Tax=Natronorubrum sp. FCH18a TaxID=3447018 RepID=UPI003F518B55